MVFHIVTIFPQFFEGPFDCGVIARARKAGQVEIRFHDLRDHASDRHRTVDDRPFGGDEGMVMKVEPIFRAVEEIRAGSEGKKKPHRRAVGAGTPCSIKQQRRGWRATMK